MDEYEALELATRPSQQKALLNAMIGERLAGIKVRSVYFNPDEEDWQRMSNRREELSDFGGEMLFTVDTGGGLLLSHGDAWQSLMLSPPEPLGPSGYDQHRFYSGVFEVLELPDWRRLLGRRIEGIDLIIQDWGELKYGSGVLERGLRFRLEGGASFIAAVNSESIALWLSEELPEEWRQEIRSITPIA